MKHKPSNRAPVIAPMNSPKPTTRFARDSRTGFTLVELLVVLAIIGVLTSLLLPALGRARARAWNTACANQLRQLGMATRMYADDFQGRLPSAELLPSLPVNPGQPLPRIVDVLGAYAGKTPASNSTAAAVFRCAADARRRYETEGSSYEWNIELNGHRIDEPGTATVRMVKIVVEEGKPVQKTDETKDLAFPPETTPLLLDYENVHARSRQPGKNVVYMDGHVAPLDPSPSASTN